MNLKVLNWNIGGAKVLEQKIKDDRIRVKEKINNDLQNLIRINKPDIVTLQEVIAYKEPSDKDITNIIEKDEIYKLGYKCFFFPLIDSLCFSSQAKWQKITKNSDWPKDSYFSQGNAILFRNPDQLFPFWDLSKTSEKSPGRRLKSILEPQKDSNIKGLVREFDGDYKNFLIEHIHLEGGVYFGDRDTEPRAALVAHLILQSPKENDPKPIDIFIVNVHLVTIMKERVGIPIIDTRATELRLKQLDVIFDGIISRYNSWFDDQFPVRGEKRKPENWETFERHKPVWLLCGDFNFTEKSVEYDYIIKRNFIDTILKNRRRAIVPDKDGKPIEHTGTKTSGPGNPATLTLDYIFAGPKFVAFDPLFRDSAMTGNKVEYSVNSSDHYPIISTIPLFMVR